jgi:hypothetical protein
VVAVDGDGLDNDEKKRRARMRKQLLHKLSRAAGEVPNTQTSQDAIDKAARDHKTVFDDNSIFSETQ